MKEEKLKNSDSFRVKHFVEITTTVGSSWLSNPVWLVTAEQPSRTKPIPAESFYSVPMQLVPYQSRVTSSMVLSSFYT